MTQIELSTMQSIIRFCNSNTPTKADFRAMTALAVLPELTKYYYEVQHQTTPNLSEAVATDAVEIADALLRKLEENQ